MTDQISPFSMGVLELPLSELNTVCAQCQAASGLPPRLGLGEDARAL